MPSRTPSSLPSSLATCTIFSSFSFRAVLRARAAASSASKRCASSASSSSCARRISRWALSSWSLYSCSSSLRRAASWSAARRASFTCRKRTTASFARASALSVRCASRVSRSERACTVLRSSWLSCSSCTSSRTSSRDALVRWLFSRSLSFGGRCARLRCSWLRTLRGGECRGDGGEPARSMH